MESEFSAGLREGDSSMSPEVSDDSPFLPLGAEMASDSATDRNGGQDSASERASKSQADDAPLLTKETPSSDDAEEENLEETLEEMERKYAAYVRHDTYGTMGRGDISIWEKACLVLALLTIVPVKVVLIFAIVVTYYIICRVCTLFRSPYHNGDGQEEASTSPLRAEGEDNNSNGSEPSAAVQPQENYADMTGVRRSIIVYSGRFLSRAVLFVLGFYWIKVTDQDSMRLLKEEECAEVRPGVIVSNHISYIDILYHMSASFPSFVAKRSVARLPLIGLISKCLGCVYVQREDKPTDFKGVSGIITERIRAAHRDKNAPLMLLFPEGTTTNGFYLLPFKTGAFLARTPVQPVILKYPYSRFSPAWDTISGVRHVILLLCQVINFLEVTWLPVYVPSEEEKSDPKIYANNVRKLMAKEGGLIPSDIGLHEKRIYHAFLKGLRDSRIQHDCSDPLPNGVELAKGT